MPAGSADIFAQMEKLVEARIQEAYERGVRAAASVADNYNSSSIHKFRLGDCILCKLNLRKALPRKNKRYIVMHNSGKSFIPEGKTTLCADGTVY